MKINRAAVKADAKLDIKNTKPNIVLFTLVYGIIAYIIRALSGTLSGYTEYIREYYDAMLSGGYFDAQGAMEELLGISPAAAVIVLALVIMSLMLGYGYTLFCLNAVRRRACSYGNLFDPFAMFFRVLWLQILTTIFVWLWSLLFIIPGIVASYRYRLALYILFDNPQMSALDCIRTSKAMTRGHKGELFVLDLSFIGWNLLCMVPLVSLWVTPYTELTNARFYVALSDLYANGGSYPGGRQNGQYGGQNQYGDPNQYGDRDRYGGYNGNGGYGQYGDQERYGGPYDAPRGDSGRAGGKPPWEG